MNAFLKSKDKRQTDNLPSSNIDEVKAFQGDQYFEKKADASKKVLDKFGFPKQLLAKK